MYPGQPANWNSSLPTDVNPVGGGFDLCHNGEHTAYYEVDYLVFSNGTLQVYPVDRKPSPNLC